MVHVQCPTLLFGIVIWNVSHHRPSPGTVQYVLAMYAWIVLLPTHHSACAEIEMGHILCATKQDMRQYLQACLAAALKVHEQQPIFRAAGRGR